MQAAYAQFQKDMPATAIASGELDNVAGGIGDSSEHASLHSRRETVIRLGRGYALGTLILIAIVITAAVVSHQSLSDFSSDVALTSDAAALVTYAANALLVLRALQVTCLCADARVRVHAINCVAQVFSYSSIASVQWKPSLDATRTAANALSSHWESATEGVFRGISDPVVVATWHAPTIRMKTQVREVVGGA